MMTSHKSIFSDGDVIHCLARTESYLGDFSAKNCIDYVFQPDLLEKIPRNFAKSSLNCGE